MEKDTTDTPVMSITSRDMLTDILRQGAQKMLSMAIENELAEYIAEHQQMQDANGHRLVTRNGHLPARTIQTGVGPIEVRQPRVRDTRIDENGHRLEDPGNDSQCILVLMGATEDGRKELIAIAEGYRESTQSWRELLVDVKHRGLSQAAKLAVGDGALGFWAALEQIYPQTQEQRCWVHKTANVLNKMPKSLQPKAKSMLHDIWMAQTRREANDAFDLFIETFRAKYPNAVECLVKDRDVLLRFYDFPAEHWMHLRTTNPIESTFATVRLRTARTKGCGSRTACLTMVFKLAQCAEKHWRRLNGKELIPEVIRGIRFVDGVKEIAA